MTIDDVDRLALERCIEIARRNPEMMKTFDSKAAAGVSWYDIGVSACFRVQIEAMSLMPWQSPPCFAQITEPRPDPVALGILERMLRVGLSRYDATPMESLAKAEARTREPAR
jgi:hypothetical protein